MQPRVSVNINTVSRPDMVREAAKSVLRQKDVDLELIIVNDGGTPETTQAVDELQRDDPRVRIVTNEKNLGIAASANRAIEVAQGEFVAKLDDDDHWIDDMKLAKQVRYLDEHSDVVLVGTGVRIIDESGNHVSDLVRKEADREIRSRILFSNRFTDSTILYRRSILQKTGGYDESVIHGNDDYDLFLRMGRYGKFHNLPDISVAYREWPTNYSAEHAKEIARSNIAIIKKYRHDYPRYIPALMVNTIRYLIAR